ENTLTAWATDPGDGSSVNNVTVYLVDHGGTNVFRTNPTETLNAADLASWLDTLQSDIDGTLTIVYDACESGSFLGNLFAPSASRVVITSTSPGEEAHFVTGGVVSFSGIFWTNILNGDSVAESFDAAS